MLFGAHAARYAKWGTMEWVWHVPGTENSSGAARKEMSLENHGVWPVIRQPADYWPATVIILVPCFTCGKIISNKCGCCRPNVPRGIPWTYQTWSTTAATACSWPMWPDQEAAQVCTPGEVTVLEPAHLSCWPWAVCPAQSSSLNINNCWNFSRQTSYIAF